MLFHTKIVFIETKFEGMSDILWHTLWTQAKSSRDFVSYICQHIRAHEEQVALQYSFYDVLSANEDSVHALRVLRERCLNPGLYAQHIERWMDSYNNKQVAELKRASC